MTENGVIWSKRVDKKERSERKTTAGKTRGANEKEEDKKVGEGDHPWNEDTIK